MAETIPSNFVYVKKTCPSIKFDIRYAGINNFTGKRVDGYEKAIAILTNTAAQQLCKIQNELIQQNKTIVIWDAYRPARAVKDFIQWRKKPDDRYIKSKFYPDLTKEDLFSGFIAPGNSSHSRGSTVDVTVMDLNTKKYLDMGTDFDFFGDISHTNSNKISEIAKQNRQLLVNIMQKYNFINYPNEWWHFTLKDEPYPNKYFDFIVR